MATTGLITEIPDILERRAEGLPAAVLARPGPVAREGAGEHAGCDHRGRKARALFVGPVDYLNRRVCLVPGLHQRAQGLECAKDAEHAIELAAGRLRVKMAAHRDRRNIVALARPPREHRAHIIDRDSAAKPLAARAKPVAHLSVEIGQRETTDTALRRAADLGGLHQLAPKALGVDDEILHSRNDQLVMVPR